MEISLNLVQVQTAKDPAAIRATAAQPRSLPPLRPPPAQRDDVVDVLLAEALVVRGGRPPLAGDEPALLVPTEAVHAHAVDPLRPVGRVLGQHLGGEDAVAGGVLDVDVEVGALHVHDDVEVELHLPPHPLLDRERVHLLAAPPPRQLREDQHQRHHRHYHRPLAAARCPRHVLRLCLCCGRSRRLANRPVRDRDARWWRGSGTGELTECIEGADDAAARLGTKGVVVEVVFLVPVHHCNSLVAW